MIGRICERCGDIVTGPHRCPTSHDVRRLVYDDPRWRQKTRPAVIARDGGRCMECGEPGNVVDHVIPIESLLELGRDPFDPWECQLLCARCSGRKDHAGTSVRAGTLRG